MKNFNKKEIIGDYIYLSNLNLIFWCKYILYIDVSLFNKNLILWPLQFKSLNKKLTYNLINYKFEFNYILISNKILLNLKFEKKFWSIFYFCNLIGDELDNRLFNIYKNVYFFEILNKQINNDIYSSSTIFKNYLFNLTGIEKKLDFFLESFLSVYWRLYGIYTIINFFILYDLKSLDKFLEKDKVIFVFFNIVRKKNDKVLQYEKKLWQNFLNKEESLWNLKFSDLKKKNDNNMLFSFYSYYFFNSFSIFFIYNYNILFYYVHDYIFFLKEQKVYILFYNWIFLIKNYLFFIKLKKSKFFIERLNKIINYNLNFNRLYLFILCNYNLWNQLKKSNYKFKNYFFNINLYKFSYKFSLINFYKFNWFFFFELKLIKVIGSLNFFVSLFYFFCIFYNFLKFNLNFSSDLKQLKEKQFISKDLFLDVKKEAYNTLLKDRILLEITFVTKVRLLYFNQKILNNEVYSNYFLLKKEKNFFNIINEKKSDLRFRNYDTDKNFSFYIISGHFNDFFDFGKTRLDVFLLQGLFFDKYMSFIFSKKKEVFGFIQLNKELREILYKLFFIVKLKMEQYFLFSQNNMDLYKKYYNFFFLKEHKVLEFFDMFYNFFIFLDNIFFVKYKNVNKNISLKNFDKMEDYIYMLKKNYTFFDFDFFGQNQSFLLRFQQRIQLVQVSFFQEEQKYRSFFQNKLFFNFFFDDLPREFRIYLYQFLFNVDMEENIFFDKFLNSKIFSYYLSYMNNELNFFKNGLNMYKSFFMLHYINRYNLNLNYIKVFPLNMYNNFFFKFFYTWELLINIFSFNSYKWRDLYFEINYKSNRNNEFNYVYDKVLVYLNQSENKNVNLLKSFSNRFSYIYLSEYSSFFFLDKIFFFEIFDYIYIFWYNIYNFNFYINDIIEICKSDYKLINKYINYIYKQLIKKYFIFKYMPTVIRLLRRFKKKGNQLQLDILNEKFKVAKYYDKFILLYNLNLFFDFNYIYTFNKFFFVWIFSYYYFFFYFNVFFYNSIYFLYFNSYNFFFKEILLKNLYEYFFNDILVELDIELLKLAENKISSNDYMLNLLNTKNLHTFDKINKKNYFFFNILLFYLKESFIIYNYKLQIWLNFSLDILVLFYKYIKNNNLMKKFVTYKYFDDLYFNFLNIKYKKSNNYYLINNYNIMVDSFNNKDLVYNLYYYFFFECSFFWWINYFNILSFFSYFFKYKIIENLIYLKYIFMNNFIDYYLFSFNKFIIKFDLFFDYLKVLPIRKNFNCKKVFFLQYGIYFFNYFSYFNFLYLYKVSYCFSNFIYIYKLYNCFNFSNFFDYMQNMYILLVNFLYNVDKNILITIKYVINFSSFFSFLVFLKNKKGMLWYSTNKYLVFLDYMMFDNSIFRLSVSYISFLNLNIMSFLNFKINLFILKEHKQLLSLEKNVILYNKDLNKKRQRYVYLNLNFKELIGYKSFSTSSFNLLQKNLNWKIFLKKFEINENYKDLNSFFFKKNNYVFKNIYTVNVFKNNYLNLNGNSINYFNKFNIDKNSKISKFEFNLQYLLQFTNFLNFQFYFFSLSNLKNYYDFLFFMPFILENSIYFFFDYMFIDKFLYLYIKFLNKLTSNCVGILKFNNGFSTINLLSKNFFLKKKIIFVELDNLFLNFLYEQINVIYNDFSYLNIYYLFIDKQKRSKKVNKLETSLVDFLFSYLEFSSYNFSYFFVWYSNLNEINNNMDYLKKKKNNFISFENLLKNNNLYFFSKLEEIKKLNIHNVIYGYFSSLLDYNKCLDNIALFIKDFDFLNFIKFYFFRCKHNKKFIYETFFLYKLFLNISYISFDNFILNNFVNKYNIEYVRKDSWYILLLKEKINSNKFNNVYNNIKNYLNISYNIKYKIYILYNSVYIKNIFFYGFFLQIKENYIEFAVAFSLINYILYLLKIIMYKKEKINIVMNEKLLQYKYDDIYNFYKHICVEIYLYYSLNFAEKLYIFFEKIRKVYRNTILLKIKRNKLKYKKNKLKSLLFFSIEDLKIKNTSKYNFKNFLILWEKQENEKKK